ALVTRVTFQGKRATGVEIVYNSETRRISAGLEVVLSLGAIHTPKLLMQSGVGDEAELQRLGIPLVQHLPGVGQNFQDHVRVSCVWEYGISATAPPKQQWGRGDVLLEKRSWPQHSGFADLSSRSTDLQR